VPTTLLLDLTHSSHTRARTGVQRVSRALHRELTGRALPVCFDPYQDKWRPLRMWELLNLEASGPSTGRAARWPLSARLGGLFRRLAGVPVDLGLGPDCALIVPEIFSPGVASALPSLLSRAGGPRVALFHDAIALQLPQFSPKSTAARFPHYMKELLLFDGVAAVSEDSRNALRDYWRWLGVSRTPVLTAITLGIDPPRTSPVAAPSGDAPTVLCVGTLEGRKNHVALLDACEALWTRGVSFNLRLIGISNRETASAALERVERLQAAGRPLRYEGEVDDRDLEAAYAQCSFTVYPSLAEGFGLPVAESLARGRPCVCRITGALGEVASGGGCVSIGAATAAEISEAIGHLLDSPADRERLEREGRARHFKTWSAYAAELLAWMGSLRRLA